LLRYGLGIVSLLFAAAFNGQAGVITFQGTFSVDDEVQLFSYRVPTTGSVTVSTTSYATGGFQTILSLFDASHNFLFDNSGYGSATDASITWNSVADELFIVALTEYDNFAVQPMLEDGFSQQGNGNFTADAPFNNPTPGGSFLLPGGEQRTSSWAVEFSSADPELEATALPEPSTFGLFLGGAAALSYWRRRRKTA